MWRPALTLFDCHARLLHDLRPLLDFGVEMARERFRRLVHGVGALRLEPACGSPACASTSAIARLSLTTASYGVPAGATMPVHADAFDAGKPELRERRHLGQEIRRAARW